MPTTIQRTPRAELHIGLGRVDITPPADAYHRNWGAALHDAAAGIHRPLTASALIFQEGKDGAEHLLVTADLGWLRTPEMVTLLERVQDLTGIDRSRLIITFSHTHAAINLDTTRAEQPGGTHIRPYLDALPERIFTAVEQARTRLGPATLTYGQGDCRLAMNRDFRDPEDETFACGPNPDDPADHTLWVARVTDASGAVRATLANYACHPTTLAWENQLISPDYPGAMRALVEEHTGAPCVFLLGACGDLGPRDGFVGDPRIADRNGRQLGHAVLSAVEALPPPGTEMRYTGKVISGATLGIWKHLPAAPKQPHAAAILRSRELLLDLECKQLPTREELLHRLHQWRAREQTAAAADDTHARRNCRAQIERLQRGLRRLEELPVDGGGSVPYRVNLWQLGEGVLVGVGGEPYSLLQRELRSRFPGTPLLVAVLSNEPHSYILPAPLCGSNRYQDEVSTLAPGSLERIIAAITTALHAWGCH